MYHKYNENLGLIKVTPAEVDKYVAECKNDDGYMTNKKTIEHLFKKFKRNKSCK